MSRGLFCEDCVGHDREIRRGKTSACEHDAAHPGLRWCAFCAAARDVCMGCGADLSADR